MFKIKILFIITTLSLLTISVFGEHIGRTVYGVFTEAYNGTFVDSSTSSGDNISFDGDVDYSITTADKVEGLQAFTFKTKSVSLGWLEDILYALGLTYMLDVNFEMKFNSDQSMSSYSGGRVYFSMKIPQGYNVTQNYNIFRISTEGLLNSDFNITRNNSNIKIVGSTTTGLQADGQWHNYYINLSDFGVNNWNVSSLFGACFANSSEVSILLDNVYWTKADTTERAFDAVIKNISDNVETSSVTWNQSCFMQTWSISDQYIELNLDRESPNWHVRILLDNNSATRNGLYSVTSKGSDIVLPMAYRVSRDLLPNSSGDTLQLAQGTNGLYDSGKYSSDQGIYHWFYCKEKTDTYDENYVKIWNLQDGCHIYTGNSDSWQTFTDFYDRYPKIYFAADCSTAKGGLKFTANIIFELYYE